MSLIVYLVGDISMAIVDRYFDLDNNNLVIRIDIDNTNK
jgi:hypothetical protein